jgi:hypothetical protein
MIKFKIPHFQLKLQKQFFMFLNANQAYKMTKKYNNFGGLNSWQQFSQSNQKKTQQNETYFPKADIDNICGNNRNI